MLAIKVKSPTTFAKMRASGEIKRPIVRHGRHYYLESDVADYIGSLPREATADMRGEGIGRQVAA